MAGKELAHDLSLMRSVLYHTGEGWGPVSDWSLAAVYVTPAQAWREQTALRLRGYRVKVVKYDGLDVELGRLG